MEKHEPPNRNRPLTPQRRLSRSLAHEVYASERLRQTILAGIYLLLLAVLLLYPRFSASYREIFGLDIPYKELSILLAGGASYEVLVWLATRGAKEREGKLSSLSRYINVFIEISFLSAAIVLMAEMVDLNYALLTPISLVYFVFIILATLRLDFLLNIFTGLVAALQYTGISLYYIYRITEFASFNTPVYSAPYHISRGAILLIAGITSGFVTLQIRKQILRTYDAISDREEIIDVFSQQVSSSVASRLIRERNMPGKTERRYVSVMFVDIRDFTQFAGNTEPEELVEYLNELFDLMVEIVESHKGIINKFTGDGFMAIFGAPEDDAESSLHAAVAGLEIVRRVQSVGNGRGGFVTQVGIGIHAGYAVAGNVGSTRRREYTVVGTVVNLASRIEGLNKMLGTQFLISDEVWLPIQAKFPHAEFIGEVAIKGSDDPVTLYKLA